MAKKNEIRFVCGDCGYDSQKWLGRCPACNAWNTFREFRESTLPKTASFSGASSMVPSEGPRTLDSVEVQEGIRFSSGQQEFDRVLGGGYMLGASLLLGGEPGIGKSTLLSQSASAVAWAGHTVLYAHGEESAAQVRLRWQRLGLPMQNVHVLDSGRLDALREAIVALKPRLVVVDSVQTLIDPSLDSPPGSIQQAKYAVFALAEQCRSVQATLCLVAHVTKEGTIAGPKVLEHMVDTVLYFEQTEGDLRVLRAQKNRFGATDELGLFRMDDSGLAELRDSSELFGQSREGDVPAGIVVVPAYEGSRSLLVELQALVVPGKAGMSRLLSEKIDQRRVSRIAAIVEKHAGLKLSDHDVYVHVAGGLKIQDLGLDLALALALYSARTGLAVLTGIAILGELSLAGEVRTIPKLKKRVQDAIELGCNQVIGPPLDDAPKAYKVVRTVRDAIQLVFGKALRELPRD